MGRVGDGGDGGDGEDGEMGGMGRMFVVTTCCRYYKQGNCDGVVTLN
ncbi:hypothetical protein [Laspinema olomoucense]|nr:hypothetical protein [Laspinema sp. D3c]MCT7994874.1 hypothetical protein [Laspinema sp. D3c]